MKKKVFSLLIAVFVFLFSLTPTFAHWYTVVYFTTSQASSGFKATISVPSSVTIYGAGNSLNTPSGRWSGESNSVTTQTSNGQWIQAGWSIYKGEAPLSYIEYFDVVTNAHKILTNTVSFNSSHTYQVLYVTSGTNANQWCGYFDGVQKVCGSKLAVSTSPGQVQSEIHFNPNTTMNATYSTLQYVVASNGTYSTPTFSTRGDYPYAMTASGSNYIANGPALVYQSYSPIAPRQ